MSYPKGIDVSKWQSTTPSLTGLDFLIARASIGTTMDLKYQDHIAAARRAGLLTGAYHFNWDDEAKVSGDPRVQARYFLDHVGDVDFLFLDVEGDHAFETAESAAFIDEVQRHGKKVGLYMSASVFRNVGQDYDWVARWGSTPPSQRWEFWQYQGSPLDKNYFNGDLEAMKALSNRKEPTNMPFYLTTSRTGTFVIEANVAVDFYKPGPDGWVKAKSRGAASTKSRPFRVIAKGTEQNGQAPTPVLQIARDDTFAPGLWVPTSKVTETLDPEVPAGGDGTVVDDGYTKATQDAAVAAAVAAQKAADQVVIDSTAANERERIAISLGKKTADEVRTA